MDIQKALEQKIEQFKSLELAKSHFEKIEKRISDGYKKLEKLQTILDKEYKDVQQLENLSFRGLFEKILGDKETQLEKERQEYLTAALNYNECVKSLELLQFEQELLRKKLKGYNTAKSQLHNLIRKREHTIVKDNELAKQLIVDLNEKIDAKIAFRRELHEAITIGLKLNRLFPELISSLEKIERWGEYILHQPDAHISKRTHIKRVQKNTYIAKQLLYKFEDELSDIYNDENIYIQDSLKTFRYFINSFFDNLISDWTVSMKIQNAQFTVLQINDKVTRITQSLQYDLKKVTTNLEEIKDKKEKIIMELN